MIFIRITRNSLKHNVIGIMIVLCLPLFILKRSPDDSKNVIPVEYPVGILETVIQAIRMLHYDSCHGPSDEILGTA